MHVTPDILFKIDFSANSFKRPHVDGLIFLPCSERAPVSSFKLKDLTVAGNIAIVTSDNVVIEGNVTIAANAITVQHTTVASYQRISGGIEKVGSFEYGLEC